MPGTGEMKKSDLPTKSIERKISLKCDTEKEKKKKKKGRRKK